MFPSDSEIPGCQKQANLKKQKNPPPKSGHSPLRLQEHLAQRTLAAPAAGELQAPGARACGPGGSMVAVLCWVCRLGRWRPPLHAVPSQLLGRGFCESHTQYVTVPSREATLK